MSEIPPSKARYKVGDEVLIVGKCPYAGYVGRLKDEHHGRSQTFGVTIRGVGYVAWYTPTNLRRITPEHKQLRKRLMGWHRAKQRSVTIIDLLESDYQIFRSTVAKEVHDREIDFYDAIRQGSYGALQRLDETINEKRLGI